MTSLQRGNTHLLPFGNGNRTIFLLILKNDETVCLKHFMYWKVLDQHEGFLLFSDFPELNRALFSYLTTGHWGSRHCENESALVIAPEACQW